MSDKRAPYRRFMPEGYKGHGGPVTYLAAGGGYALVRRPHSYPFAVPIKDWNSWEEVRNG